MEEAVLRMSTEGFRVPLHLSETRIEKILVIACSAKVAGKGLLWELSPGPLAPEARIIPLDQAADGQPFAIAFPPIYVDTLVKA